MICPPTDGLEVLTGDTKEVYISINVGRKNVIKKNYKMAILVAIVIGGWKISSSPIAGGLANPTIAKSTPIVVSIYIIGSNWSLTQWR